VDEAALDALLRDEEAAHVRDAVAALPLDQRTVLILRVYHDMSYREIAHITDASEQAVRVRAHRARQALKDALAPSREERPCRR
jgi:RNA polymerase sigma-70 factor (ECF subfamily)